MDHHKEIKILLAIICSGILVVACSCGISALSGEITIRELCGYNESDTPSELYYSYIDDSSGSTIEVTVDDEAIIKQTLATILDTKVPIWYDPNNPKVFFVAQDQSLRHDIIIGRCVLGVSIFLVIAGIIAFISI